MKNGIRSSHPGDFGRETFNVVFFALENALRDKHGEIGVLHSEFLDTSVEPLWTG
jgi:hypothetical protein